MSSALTARVKTTRVLVVGCGGTGNVVVSALTQLGFGDLTLCDPDRLETSNLNRFVPASLKDVGRPKAEILAEWARARGKTDVEAKVAAFPDASAEAMIAQADVVLSCLDVVHTRLQLDMLARSMGKPVLDLGVGFNVVAQGEGAADAGGQVLLSRADGPCLQCHGYNILEQGGDYYVSNLRVPDASSFLLNSIVGSLGVELLIEGLASDWRIPNQVCFSRRSMSITRANVQRDPQCTVCGSAARLDFDQVREYLHAESGRAVG
ncbi:MAG: ThiF family adenylyltransferase [Myxococcota bacterium]